MRALILFTVLFVFNTAIAASGEIKCKPTVGPGLVNYSAINNGLSRISEIVVAYDSLGGIQLTLNGTAGAGDTPASVSHELVWASNFGDQLSVYNNIETAASTQEKPSIRFEMEHLSLTETFLGVLTFSSVKDPKSNRIINSRYNCKVQQ
jgi:hypothetical protein